MTPATLLALLQAQAGQTPDAPAITAPERTALTYEQLYQHTCNIVARLNALNIGGNDRVALVMPNGPEMMTAFLAVAAGATAAPLNPTYQTPELEFCLSDLRAKAVIVQAGLDSPVRAVAQAQGILVVELSFSPEDAAGIFTLSPTDATGNAPLFAQTEDVALLLHTSGTMARPKLVPITQANLLAGAEMTASALELTAADRYLCIMPQFHAHALVTSIAALLSGGCVFASPGFDDEQFFTWVRNFQPTWWSGAPTLHQAILAQAPKHQALIERIPLRLLRSSAASLPPTVLTSLEATFKAPVIEGYGMTESVLYLTNNPLSKRKRGSVGVAAASRSGLINEVAILDESGQRLAPRVRGEVVVRGPNITPGYDNNPEANAEAFEDGWFHTGDQGYLDEEGYLYLTGRLKEIINRGGEKISPREVDEALKAHPEIVEAVTFAVPHPTLGEDIAAAVILRENSPTTALDIRRFVAARLAPFKVPRQIVLVEEIPTGPTGKLQRLGLAEIFADQLKTEFVAPRTWVEETLADIWSEVLETEPIGVNDNFFSLGGTSLSATRVAARIRQKLQIELPLETVFDTATIATLAEALQTEKSADIVSRPILKPIIHHNQAQNKAAMQKPIDNVPSRQPHQATPKKKSQAMDFSLFFFSADGSAMAGDKYRLFLESVKFADQQGFTAVWTPERHFHAFGGLYPNPAVLGAAVATMTKNIQIRAGSVVIPFQDPLRVAEEWSVIDNLSGGRVGIACASGWHANDFVLAPDNYAERKQIMLERIEIIQRLWRGENITLPNGNGKPTEVRIYPQPIQPSLPIWIASHSEATFIKAGEIGANVLTVLWDTTIEDVARKIELYRKSLAQHGHDPEQGQVTLMLHTFVADSMDIVREKVKTAYEEYLYVNLGLQENQAEGVDKTLDLTQDDKAYIIAQATEKLFSTRGLVGTPEICLEKVKALQAIGVDEVACLIDFGVDFESTMASLSYLNQVKTTYQQA